MPIATVRFPGPRQSSTSTGTSARPRLRRRLIASSIVVDALSIQAREYLLELGREAVPGIESALKVATDSEHRASLIQIVGYIGTRDDLPIIEPFLKDPDQRVIRAATNAVLRLRR